MLDYLLEEPCERTNKAWDTVWLMYKFEKEVVAPKIRDPEVVEEMRAGVPVDDLLDDIWKGFEEWADEYLNDEKQAYYEGLDERD